MVYMGLETRRSANHSVWYMKIYIPKRSWKAKGAPKPLAKGKYAKASRQTKAWLAKSKAKT